MKITLRQLADDLNISTATVSLALNDAPRISKETKERVHAYAKKVGYRSNRLARNLRLRRTRVIGCVLPSVVSPVVALTLKYLYIEAFRRNYQIQVLFSETDLGQEIRAIEECLDSQVDGLILQSVSRVIELCGRAHPLNRRELKRFPIVSLSTRIGSFPCVRNGFESALQTCMQHARKKGYRGVALLATENSLTDSSQSREAFTTIAEQNGFAEEHHFFVSVHTELERLNAANSSGPKMQQYYDFDRLDEEGYRGAPELLKACSQRPLAVICRNDQLAAGFLRYCREQEVKIPSDVGIIGIDDTLSHYLAVTSIRWDYPQRARLIFDHLEACIDGKTLPAPPDIDHHLVERASTQRYAGN